MTFTKKAAIILTMLSPDIICLFKDDRSVSLYLIIGHKSVNMLSILNNKHWKGNCKILWQIMCFWTKSKNATTTI